jgi:creatinine amidohydrolase
VARAGIRKLVLFNGHGGQPQIVDIVAQRLRSRHGLLVVRASYFRFGVPDHLIDPEERRYGLHGGELETSLMLAIEPDLVQMENAQRFLSRAKELEQGRSGFRVEGPAGIGWMAEDLNPAGVVGDASAASADKGRVLLDHYAERLASLLVELAQLKWRPAPLPAPASDAERDGRARW